MLGIARPLDWIDFMAPGKRASALKIARDALEDDRRRARVDVVRTHAPPEIG
jgi:hypothetical protein